MRGEFYDCHIVRSRQVNDRKCDMRTVTVAHNQQGALRNAGNERAKPFQENVVVNPSFFCTRGKYMREDKYGINSIFKYYICQSLPETAYVVPGGISGLVPFQDEYKCFPSKMKRGGTAIPLAETQPMTDTQERPGPDTTR